MKKMNENEIHKKKIASRIRVIRNELGLTMKEFGQKFDPPASDSIVSRWERGISAPNNERLKRIAELGNVSMFYLTTGKKAIVDLSTDEKKEASETIGDTFKRNKNDQREYVRKEIESIQISDLNLVETAYFIIVFEFLKFSDTDDIVQLGSLIRLLNDSDEIKMNDKISQEELNEYIDDLLKRFENLVKKRFL